MIKRVMDLTPDELDRLAQEAWKVAAEASLKSGADLVGNFDVRVLKISANGKREFIGRAPTEPPTLPEKNVVIPKIAG
jgi:hypothetical protein